MVQIFFYLQDATSYTMVLASLSLTTWRDNRGRTSMIISNRAILVATRPCLFALLSGIFLIANVQAQGLTNRTPDKAKIYPETTPTAEPSPSPPHASVIADPTLFRPEKRSKPVPEFKADLAYYIYVNGVSRLKVSDARGATDDLFAATFFPRIRSATYHFVGSDSVYIIVPVNETYSLTFESNEPVMYLEIVKGRGNTPPEEAIRYRDLILGAGRAKLEITPHGIGPLRVDTNQGGRFDSLIEPTAMLRGLAATDTEGPAIKIRVVERNANTILISIEAKDKETGLKSLYYSLDGQTAFPYQSPVRIDLKQTSSVWAFADDYSGNRSVYKYDF